MCFNSKENEVKETKRMISVDEIIEGVRRLVESKKLNTVKEYFSYDFGTAPDYVKEFFRDSKKVIDLARKFLPWRAKETDPIKIRRKLEEVCNYDKEERFNFLELRIYQKINPYLTIEKYTEGTNTGDSFTNWEIFKKVVICEYLLQAIAVCCQENDILENEIKDGFNIRTLVKKVEDKVFYGTNPPFYRSDWPQVEKILKQEIDRLVQANNIRIRSCLKAVENEIAKEKNETIRYLALTELKKVIVEEMIYLGYRI